MNITHIVLLCIAVWIVAFVVGCAWGGLGYRALQRRCDMWRTLAEQLGGKREDCDE